MNKNHGMKAGSVAVSVKRSAWLGSAAAFKCALLAALFAVLFACSASFAFADTLGEGESGSGNAGSDSLVQNEAKYNGVEYSTLTEALEAYKGLDTGAIYLLKDVEGSYEISGNNGTYTSAKIILGGHSIAASNGNAALSVNGVSLEIVNGSADAMGCVSAVDAPAVFCSGGSVKTEVSLLGTVSESATAAGKTATAAALNANGSLTVNGGVIEGAIAGADAEHLFLAGGSFDTAEYLGCVKSGKAMIKRAGSGADSGRYEVADANGVIEQAASLVAVPVSGGSSDYYKLYFESEDEATSYAQGHSSEGVWQKKFITATLTLAKGYKEIEVSGKTYKAYTYDGDAKLAKVSFSGVDKGDLLVGNLAYKNNLVSVDAPQPAGWYSVKLTGFSADGVDEETAKEIEKKYELRTSNGANPEEVFVIQPASIEGATVAFDADSATYDGKEHKPTVSSVEWNGETLVEGTDYTVSYERRDGKDADDFTSAGAVTAVITGMGNFDDGTTATAEFTINPASIEGASVKLGDALTYNGKVQTQTVQSVTVLIGEDDDEHEVVLKGDELANSIEVSNNTAKDYRIGAYTLIITGKGNFTGEWAAGFNVNPLYISKATVELGDALTYNGKDQAQTVKSVTVGEGDSAVDVDLDSLEISGNTGKNAGDYESLVLTAKEDSNFVGSTSAQKFTIKPCSIKGAKVTLANELTYNGKEQTQQIEVTAGEGDNKVAVPAESLSIEGNTGTDADRYTMTISIKDDSNFTGETTKDFTIKRLSLDEAVITLGKVVTYNNYEQVQTIDSVAVGEGEDAVEVPLESLLVSGNKVTDAGEHSLQITAKEKTNFVGHKKFSFTINSRSIADATIELSKSEFTYNGKAQNPSIKSVVVNDKILKDGVDYTADIAEGTKVGTYQVTLTATGGTYTGVASATYVINPKGVAKFKVSKAKKAFKASWSKLTSERDGVELKYSTKKSMAKAKTVKAKGASAKAKTVKKLKKKTKYYVQARAYKVVNGKTYYSGWSKVKTVKTK
ncbi:MAG: MBG domain-containing protein [Coriobacteriia bacterium]|nr:MBG domain-containing protein [Coriobacteriia bacterium]